MWKKKQLLIRFLVMLVPAYFLAFITVEMKYMMPMLAACALIATNLYDEERLLK